jgi:hypothetical protein
MRESIDLNFGFVVEHLRYEYMGHEREPVTSTIPSPILGVRIVIQVCSASEGDRDSHLLECHDTASLMRAWIDWLTKQCETIHPEDRPMTGAARVIGATV